MHAVSEASVDQGYTYIYFHLWSWYLYCTRQVCVKLHQLHEVKSMPYQKHASAEKGHHFFFPLMEQYFEIRLYPLMAKDKAPLQEMYVSLYFTVTVNIEFLDWLYFCQFISSFNIKIATYWTQWQSDSICPLRI